MKKILALVLAALMVAAMIPAMAASNGTITVTKNFKDQTYELFQLFDAITVAGRTDGGEGISYRLMDGKTDLVASVNGTNVDGATWFTKDAKGNITIKDSDAATILTGIGTNATTAANRDAFIAWAKAYGVSKGTKKANSDNDTSVKWESLPEGYYFLTTTTGALISLDSIKPNVSVEDKNSVPTIEKKITVANNGGVIEDEGDSAQVKIGDIITYTVTIKAKKGAENYVFHDKLSAGLTLLAQNDTNQTISVSAGEGNYNIVYWDNTDVATAEGDKAVDDNITIRFTKTYLDSLTADTDITISYNVQVNDNAVIGNAGNPNTVYLEYGHDPNSTDSTKPGPKTEEDTVTVYTYAIALKKVNKAGEALGGATFQLPFYVKATQAADGSYIYAGTTAADGLVNTVSTVAGDGTITIKGLQHDKTYSITETVAPEGYNILTGTVDVKPVKTSTTTTKITRYLDENGQVTDEETETKVEYTPVEAVPVSAFSAVVNFKGTELPSTGGMGTTLFYVGGSILVLAAVILLVTKRRMSAND